MEPVLHVVLRMAFDDLALHLKLDHSDGLVHLGRQPRIHRVINIFIQDLRHKVLAGIVPVDSGCKHGQRTQVDSVAVLQKVEAVVADGDPQDVADAGQVARGRPHPGNIMVAPLDIHIVELHQLFHNDICSGSPVKDIADDMEIVDGQVLDQVAQRLDELRAHFAVDDGADDLIVVYLLVFIAVIHMDQLVDDISECRRHFLTHLGSGVFGRHLFTDAYKAVNGDPLPVLCKPVFPLRRPQPALRVVDQVRQGDLILIGDHIAKGLGDLFPDDTGRAPKEMDKGLVFPMQVTEKIFRSLGKAADGHQVDDLAGRCLDIGIFPG